MNKINEIVKGIMFKKNARHFLPIFRCKNYLLITNMNEIHIISVIYHFIIKIECKTLYLFVSRF